MQPLPLRTAVIGSYPLPGWLQFASANPTAFGNTDCVELYDDAVTVAVQDQLAAGLDVISDGEQTRADGTLSFYRRLQGIERESEVPRRFGPAAQDQRPKHNIIAPLTAPDGLGVVEEFQRLTRLAPSNGPALKVSIPGPYTLSGGLFTNNVYPNRLAVTEGLVPIVRKELLDLADAGCREIMIDEPSMACYAHRDDPARFADILNRTIEPTVGKCRLSLHLCFGNYQGRAVGPRSYRPIFPAFSQAEVDEFHLEMANREFAELEIIGEIAAHHDVAVGIADVKNYYIETPDDIVSRVRRCLKFAPAEKLCFTPDCGLSQTARWAAKQKLKNLVLGVHQARRELGLS